MPNNPVQEAIRKLVREELNSIFGFVTSAETTQRERIGIRKGPVRRRKATLYGGGKGAVSDPKTDKRLKKNRDSSEE